MNAEVRFQEESNIRRLRDMPYLRGLSVYFTMTVKSRELPPARNSGTKVVLYLSRLSTPRTR